MLGSRDWTLSKSTAVDASPTRMVESATQIMRRPRARGWIHVYSAAVAIVASVLLVAMSFTTSTAAGLTTAIYAVALVAMFGVSAVYHRVEWRSSRTKKWMMRADHSMIFVFIAATFTPFAAAAMPHNTRILALTIVWTGATAGVTLKMAWPNSPRWIGIPLYLALGWTAIVFARQLLDGAGFAATMLLLIGGVLYNIGTVMYVLKRPDPWPTTFGYHEFFHAFTALGAICHHIALWLVIA
ncbi:hemolysin III family protein [Mycobacterium sp. 852002-40037_SCH5390672]|uniref:PAQR family membrane homeostasis protein TrhA n=1 Tax=Mycobacterium sp. 852002-40037_SCH5390672 TaxID=1834089 RepID=UPI0012E8D3B7